MGKSKNQKKLEITDLTNIELDKDSELLYKIANPKEILKLINGKNTPIELKLRYIEKEVNRVLGKRKNEIMCIRNKSELTDYITTALKNGIIAIDTETNNSLNTMTCMLVGACIYTPGLKAAYIPVNHIDRISNELLPNQLTEEELYTEFKRLKDIEIITHNGKFDYEVLYNTIHWEMPVTWCTSIGSRLLNENESHELKEQYRLHIDPTQEKYDIEHLFKKLAYRIIDPELFSYYAATDAKITYELMEYQKKEFNKIEFINIYRNDDEVYTFDITDDVETVNGYKQANLLTIEDKLVEGHDIYTIKNVLVDHFNVFVEVFSRG